jgi:hypothetical protein
MHRKRGTALQAATRGPSPLSGRPISKAWPRFQQQENLLPVPVHLPLGHFALPPRTPQCCSRMLAAFPFNAPRPPKRLVLEEFSSHLGSTHPSSNAVSQEPFSTSVFEDHTGIFATTTKIGTRGRSSRAHAPAFAA